MLVAASGPAGSDEVGAGAWRVPQPQLELLGCAAEQLPGLQLHSVQGRGTEAQGAPGSPSLGAKQRGSSSSSCPQLGLLVAGTPSRCLLQHHQQR